MRAQNAIGALALAVLASCGLEGMFGNTARTAYHRPASAIRGSAPWAGARASQITVTDGDLNAFPSEKAPFSTSVTGGSYEVLLPSSRYSMTLVHGRAGDTELRAIVPFVGEESAVTGVDLDARNMTETLIVEAALSAKGKLFRQLTPTAYVGDGVTSGTRTLIRQAFDNRGTSWDPTGATQDLLLMVQQYLAHSDPSSGAPDPFLFFRPVLDASYNVTKSPLDPNWLTRNGLGTSAAFDAQLKTVAQLYKPEGCPDPNHIRLVFTVDFTQGTLDGNGAPVNRFKWAVDKPGKKMFFVGWLYTKDPPGASGIQDPAVNAGLGAGVPNTVPMYDDGTNGDEVAGDGIWTVTFDVPRDPATTLRIGYKYTWGFRGDLWTGDEEWPGNARIIQVEDLNGDEIVYRRDVFQDEATNKDFSNLSHSGGGGIDWETDLRGCGRPEARENGFVPHNAQACGPDHTPTSVGPITVACTQ